MGYGLVHVKGNTVSCIKMGVLNLSKFTSHELKLKKYFQEYSC